MDFYKKNELQTIYNSTNAIDKNKADFYSTERQVNRVYPKSNFILDSAIFFVKERLSIDNIIKELTFTFIALTTYFFMQYTGRISSLKGFGYFIGLMLISAAVYNLYKASFRSLAPGLFCLIGGLFLLTSNIQQQFFKFLSTDSIEYIIGIGALFIALSLFKTSDNY